MKLTAIDIGTNTILMLIVDLTSDERIKILRDEVAFPRLGKGVDRNRMVSSATIDRVLQVLKDYKMISDELGSEKIVACGTSALRDSHNRQEVVQRIREECGIDVEVLSGDEEARWTFEGAVAGFRSPTERFAVIDIGGGSTEVIFGRKGQVERRKSLNLGCVRLTERFLQRAPPTQEALQEAATFARRSLLGLGKVESEGSVLVGVAGTVTTLAALDLELPEFDSRKLEGHLLLSERVEKIFTELQRQTTEEIRSSPLIPSGRADVLLAGALILIEFMTLYAFDRITVSTQGLRYGLILRELLRSGRLKESSEGNNDQIIS